MNWFTLLFPVAMDIVRAYIKSSDSDSDDKVLELVQDGVCYLEAKDNNTVDSYDKSTLLTKKMKG